MNKKKTILSVSVLFFLATNAYAQTDSTKTSNVEEVVILGSRSGARSKIDSPVPVDVFNLKQE